MFISDKVSDALTPWYLPGNNVFAGFYSRYVGRSNISSLHAFS